MKFFKSFVIIAALLTASSCSYFSNNSGKSGHSYSKDYSSSNKVVYFDLDSSFLKRKYKKRLSKNVVKWIKANPKLKVVIEGHADERGTHAYNKELGMKRAKAVKKFLISKGISSSRIKTISYGETRPADKGNNESAWKKNRRAVTLAIR